MAGCGRSHGIGKWLSGLWWVVVPQLGLLEFVGELWRVVASCGGLWVSCGKHGSTGGSCWAGTDTAGRQGAQSTSVPGRQFALVATVVGGCRLESSDLNTALTRIEVLAQAKEGPAAWLEHSVHFPVFGVYRWPR